MRIKRRYMPVVVVAGITVGVGLALLVALLAGVGTASAEWCSNGVCCDRDPMEGLALCVGPMYCWGPDIVEEFGCERIQMSMANPRGCSECVALAGTSAQALQVIQQEDPDCDITYQCVGTQLKQYSSNIWLADVCEPDDGFSANGEMTLDSNTDGPLEIGASFDGPWYSVEVNGPPWVVTEEMLEAFAEMVGVEDWHDLWVRSGDGYPQYLGNMIIERDGRMDLLCAE
jgi:hypothetical protein